MGRFINYKRHEKIGECIYLKDAEWEHQKSGNRIRRAWFKCKCGKVFNTRMSSIKNGHIKSCGCYNIESAINRNTIHGLCYDRNYYRWQSIKERCYNKNNESYKSYGGRGIKMYDKWIDDFISFHKYVSSLPKYGQSGLSLDRINNNGNYEPGNLRWTSAHIQSLNKRIRSDNKSGYTGVYFDKRKNSWYSEIKVRGNKMYLGSFDNKISAAKARDQYIIDNNLNEYSLNLARFFKDLTL